MLVKFWKFSKRHNSTKQVTANSPWSPQVNLKSPTSLHNPTLLMGSQEGLEQVTSYNYCQIGSTYYFIDEWTSVHNDLWECKCSIDLLATYKSNILRTSAFVEYDTIANTYLVDNRMSTRYQKTESSNVIAFEPTISSSGMFLLTVTGKNESLGTVALSQAELTTLLNNAEDFTNTILEEEDILKAIAKLIGQLVSGGKCAENIRACKWVPFSDIDLSYRGVNVYLGNYDTTVLAKMYTQTIYSNVVEIPIPWVFSDWRNSSYCTTIGVYLPFVGNVAISPELVQGDSVIQIQYTIDIRSGGIAYCLTTSRTTLGTYGGNVASDVPVGISNINIPGYFNSLANVGVGLATGNSAVVGAGVAQAAFNLMTPHQTCVGGASSSAGAALPHNKFMSCFITAHNTNVSPDSLSPVIGTPSMRIRKLSSLTGYVKTRGASVDAPASSVELKTINSMLDGGIYIE